MTARLSILSLEPDAPYRRAAALARAENLLARPTPRALGAIDRTRFVPLVEAELRLLRAAAPLPPPPDRSERRLALGLADLFWLLDGLERLRLGQEVAAADPLPALALGDQAFVITEGWPGVLDRAVATAAFRHRLEARDLLQALDPSRLGDPVAIPLDRLREGAPERIEAFGRTIAVVRLGDEVFAVADLCPHRGGSLGSGQCQDGALICPFHGWDFDVRTGQCRRVPGVEVERFRVRLEGEKAWIEPPPR